MTAAININRGKASMAFVGELPWHGLGQKLTPDSALEVWLKEAGMDWRVQRSRVRYATTFSKDGSDEKVSNLKVWDDNHVLFRSDTNVPLSIVSAAYKVVQPREVLEFFRSLTEKNDMQLETAGVLHGGEKYWALAKTKYNLRVAGTDLLGGYLLLATSCDGSLSTTAKFTSVRVVCQNTLSASLSGGGEAIRVPHSTKFDAEKVKIDLGLLDKAWKEFGENAEILVKKKMTPQTAIISLIKAWGDHEQFQRDLKTSGIETALDNQEKAKVMAEVVELFGGGARGADMKSSKGTAWGLLNAATEYFDHNAGRSRDRRLSSAWFGKNANKKTALMTELLAA